MPSHHSFGALCTHSTPRAHPPAPHSTATPLLQHTVRTISLKEEAEALHSMNMHQSPAPLWLRLLTRPVYVLLTTAVALVLPGFTPFLGLVGGLM